MRIEDVLSPISPMQPDIEPPIREVTNISRIPMIVGPTGEINPQFQSFYNDVLRGFYPVTQTSVKHLYSISDKAVNESDFLDMVNDAWGKFENKMNFTSFDRKGFDIQLDVESFKTSHRSILGKFNLLAWMLEDVESDILDKKKLVLKKYMTSIYFTYRDNKFLLVSYFTPYILVDDE